VGIGAVKSDAARAFIEREKILSRGLWILGEASRDLKSLDKETLSVCGDLAYDLLTFSPGYAGKLLLIISRLFSNLAEQEEEAGFAPKIRTLKQLNAEMDQLELIVG
jgi:hypothetical protein